MNLVDRLRAKAPSLGFDDYDPTFDARQAAAAEILRLRDCLGSIRAHLVGQDSALAVAIRATCDSGLKE